MTSISCFPVRSAMTVPFPASRRMRSKRKKLCAKNSATWRGLFEKLSQFETKVELITPQPKLPDMVFTANAGLAVGRKFIPSNFRHEERAGEAPFFAKWMEDRGYEILWLPPNLYFEGE